MLSDAQRTEAYLPDLPYTVLKHMCDDAFGQQGLQTNPADFCTPAGIDPQFAGRDGSGTVDDEMLSMLQSACASATQIQGLRLSTDIARKHEPHVDNPAMSVYSTFSAKLLRDEWWAMNTHVDWSHGILQTAPDQVRMFHGTEWGSAQKILVQSVRSKRTTLLHPGYPGVLSFSSKFTLN